MHPNITAVWKTFVYKEGLTTHINLQH